MPENKKSLVEKTTISTSFPKNKAIQFSTFGWQGISFIHPRGWNVSKLSKDYANGEVFLDDGFMIRVELHWYTPTSSFKLEKLISKHIAILERETKRKKLPFSVQRKLNPPSQKIFTKERNGEFFILDSGWRASCIIWYCKTCGRVLLMRVYSKKEEDIQAIISKIYDSLKDHPDNKMSWGIYELFFRIPKDYKLSDYSLKSGYLKLIFNRKKDKFIIERWSLGNILLKEKNLKEWFFTTYSAYNRYLSGVTLEENNGHTEFDFSVAYKERILMFAHRSFLMEGKVWHCKSTNRVFVLLYSSPESVSLVLERFYKDVICHT